MINIYRIKKIGVLVLLPLIGSIGFYSGLMFYGFIGALGFMFVATLLGYLIGNAMLSNPFSSMLEGQGILVLDMNSTGIIRPFIAQVHNPYMSAKGFFRDVFDRKAVHSLAVPKKAGEATSTKEGGLKIEIDEKQYNSGRFALFHYPVVIWNAQINSVLTKDWLSNKENEGFANHTILYLNRTLEDLSSNIRNFGRHIVDQIRPKGEWMKNPIVMWIVVGLLIILGVMFLSKVLPNLMGSGIGGAAANAIGGGSGGAIVTPAP